MGIFAIHNKSIIAKLLLQSTFIHLLRNYSSNRPIKSSLLFHARDRTDAANKAILKLSQLYNCPRNRDISMFGERMLFLYKYR